MVLTFRHIDYKGPHMSIIFISYLNHYCTLCQCTHRRPSGRRIKKEIRTPHKEQLRSYTSSGANVSGLHQNVYNYTKFTKWKVPDALSLRRIS